MSTHLARLGRALFAWSSAVIVAACGLAAWGGSQVTIMGAGNVHGLGLTYEGRAQALLAFGEATFVLLAWFASRAARPAARRAGALGLLAWALLWSVSAARWMRAAPETMTIGIGSAILLCSLCALALAFEPRTASEPDDRDRRAPA